jgi:predicted ribosomally synthesized peptide with nif11-like leader
MSVFVFQGKETLMSHTAARSFLEKVYNDNALLATLPPDSAGRDARIAAAVKIGPQHGYEFTSQELSEVQAVKEFWKKASQDESLQEKLKAAGAIQNPEQSTSRVVEIAKAAGYSFPASVVKEVSQPALEIVKIAGGSAELKEDQLETVVGGATLATTSSTALFGSLASPTLTSPTMDLSRYAASTVMCPW